MVRTRAAVIDDAAPGAGIARGRGQQGVSATSKASTREAASEEEQLRLARFKKYDPPTFSGLASESAQGFLEDCHRILRTMGIVETSGVVFTTFQLREAAYQWWWAYELGSPAELASLTCV